ncbi:hypothetical protein [Methylibium sp.]|uniref:hypothetical protein n=1 Tax=Methylibium sp. TaxID=2067992 RepID=UPI0017F20F0E|nr:hypothetical protein [Methylibium sp.]MBA3588206.1 hypothetical protein [Methylibium sp.]
MLKNAYVTDGKTIRKRPGCVKVATLSKGTFGLFSGLGRLNTFQATESTAFSHDSTLLVNNRLSTEIDAFSGVSYCDTFNGFLYVVAQVGTTYRHHYLDGDFNTIITDSNCPRTAIAAKAASKMWAGKDDVVRFCATNNPRDWTLANDAGFLPVGLQQSGSRNVTAIGNYQNRLVPFFPDSAQIWEVDPDPINHKFLQSVDIGTTRPYTHQNMAGDVFYLSPAGVRTITKQADTENLIDADVGSPIDNELLNGTFLDLNTCRAQYFRGAGQYWLYAGNTAAVFTFSRTAKISAWSIYEFPFSLDYIDELDTFLYIRSGDEVYRMDRATWTDAGVPFTVEIETSFVDFKGPGVLKQILAMDAVVSGTAEFSHRYDPRSPSIETFPAVTITGDTRPGTQYPVELMTTSLSTVVRNSDDQEFELHSLSYMFENLSSSV